MKNYLLFVFDILVLPITLFRLLLIYNCGAKYNIKGLNFLDVMMHSNNQYFNINDNTVVNTISDDLRVRVRDDSRLYPKDIKLFLENNKDFLIQNTKDTINKETNNDRELDVDSPIINIKQNIFNTTDKKIILKNKDNDSSCISNKYSSENNNELDENTTNLTGSISEKAHLRLEEEVDRYYKSIDD